MLAKPVGSVITWSQPPKVMEDDVTARAATLPRIEEDPTDFQYLKEGDAAAVKAATAPTCLGILGVTANHARRVGPIGRESHKISRL